MVSASIGLESHRFLPGLHQLQAWQFLLQEFPAPKSRWVRAAHNMPVRRWLSALSCLFRPADPWG